MKKLVLVLLLAGFVPGTSMADQCQWNKRSISQRARALMVHFENLYGLCENCGETEFTKYEIQGDDADTLDKKNLHFKDMGNELGARYWEFTINEGTEQAKSLDLAYTYVRMDGKFKNVGALFACLDGQIPPDGVTAEFPNEYGDIPNVKED